MPKSNTISVQVSVVIPAHNAEPTLGRQLEALTLQIDPPNFEVIVVANCCTDDTVTVARDFGSKLDLTVIEANDVASAAYARNVGADHARGKYLLFCDADDVVQAEWVRGMVEPLVAGRADFVGGWIELDRKNLPNWIFQLHYAWLKEDRLLHREPLPWTISACLGVTVEAFRSIGGFDTDFVACGGEEIHLQRQMLRRGFRVGEAPRARVLYSPRTTFRTALTQALSYHRGANLLCTKEGLTPERLTLLGFIRRSFWQIAWILVRRRYCHPNLVTAIFLLNFKIWRSERSNAIDFPKPVIDDHPIDACAPLDTPIIGGLAFGVPEPVQRDWLTTRQGIESGTLRVIQQLMTANGLFIDVGANVGVLSIAAAMCNQNSGRVIAFEPNKTANSCLHANIERHRVGHLINVREQAVGSDRGFRKFNCYGNSLLSGFGEALERYTPGELLRKDVVEVITLDEAIDQPADILKIDVEGFESDVLSGARDLIRRSPSIAVIAEINPPILRALDRRIGELLEFFPTDDWSLYKITEEDRSHPLELVEPASAEERFQLSDGFWNLLAVRTTQIGGLRNLIAATNRTVEIKGETKAHTSGSRE